MVFKLYECDIGIKVNGVTYDFPDVMSVAIEDPEKNKLTRGASGGNKLGIPYKEGVKDPKHWTIQIMNMDLTLKGLFDTCFDNQTRVTVFCIVRKDGSSKLLKQAILTSKPQQLNLTEQPDSMTVQLEFDSYDSSEDHKS